MATQDAPPPSVSARFTLELEFVLCLSHPGYLQHLALNYPHLLSEPTTSSAASSDPESEAACFARYLAYLYRYWRTPEYSKYLTYPAATLRNLELLQNEEFRKDLIKPDVIARLDHTLKPEEVGESHNQEVLVAEPVSMDTAPG